MPVKDLHVANSIYELNGKCVVDILKKFTLIQLSKSAQKLLEHAERHRLDGDEENSYILYMKYLHIVQHIQQNPDYSANKKAIMEIITKKDTTLALDTAETISKSLIKRYEDKRQLEKLDEYENQNIVRKKIETDRENAKKNFEHQFQPSFTFPDEEDASITVRHLYKLLQDQKNAIMVLDTRSDTDYKESHMAHHFCINVPQEKIIMGYTPDRIIRSLPHSTIDVWNKRKNMELIVLLDWSSTKVESGSKLEILQNAILKWDVEVNYKRKPIILDGGYEAWLLAYPTKTTNPRVTAPITNTNLDDLLDDIEYPSLNDTPPEKKPSIIIANGSSSNVPQFNRETKFIPTATGMNPMVDRSKKAAALQTYDRKAKEMKMLIEQNEKLANDSITIEKERIEAEENWEEVYNSHEKEAEEGKKETLQLKKDELQSYLLQLESKQCDTMLEIDQIKNQLAELKDDDKQSPDESNDASLENDSKNSIAEEIEAEEEANKAMEEALERERKIQQIEDEKAELAQKRELLQVERERKLAEARAQKKLLYKQYEENEIETVPLKTDEYTTGFKRSHSSPNIAQIMDEEMFMKVKVPHFDRNVKPNSKAILASDYNQARQRDFQGILGCLGRGLTGLKNLGNTCYMNSIMQCLSNTADLAVYFQGNTYREDVRDAQIYSKGNSGTRGAVAEEVAAVVKALWSGQFKFISAKDLRNVVGRHQVMFRGFEQQDSHEFLTILMDWLHNDLQTPTRRQIQMESLPAAEKAWLEYTKSKESLILKLFYGQIKSTLTCLTCRKKSVTHDSFSNLSLELPAHANKCSLTDCLELYLQDERISDWNCPNCKTKRDAVKKLDISRLPPILVIHFKRFYLDPTYMANCYKKKLTNIDFPLFSLNMGQFSTESCRHRKNTTYNLYGVSNHYGSMEGGHYTAYCKSSVYSKWYKFDDHVVTEIPPSNVKSSAAYILFYSSLLEK